MTGINQPDLVALNEKYGRTHHQRFNMAGYAAPKLNTVRVGIIGLGNRGPSHLKTLIQIEGVEIRALCDRSPEKVEEALKHIENTDHSPVLYTGGEDEWKRLCERQDIDLVVVTTPYFMHVPMSVYAMKQGKHVATDVPAAGTMEECWELVQTAEETQRHLMMLEYSTAPIPSTSRISPRALGREIHATWTLNSPKVVPPQRSCPLLQLPR